MHDKPVPFSWKNVLTPLTVWTVVAIVVLDQVSKYAIIYFLEVGQQIEVLPFFNLVHYKNKGAAFGMFHETSAAFRLVFFGMVTIACLAFLVWSLGTAPLWDRFHRFNLALILGGALGNLKDRVIYQQVTDFVLIYYKDYSWPAFNVADSAISVGVTLLLLSFIPWHKWLGKLKR